MTKQVPWLRVFVEGVVIVGSILLAFGIEAWWDGVQEGRLELEYAERLKDDLAGDTLRFSDLHPDGDRLVVPQDVAAGTAPEGAASEPERFLVVVNWFEELRQRMGN